MPTENVVNLGREFSVTVESFRNSSGEEVMRWDFEANIDDPLKRTNLIIAMWDALEKAFRNSGFMRLEQTPGEIHSICELGRSHARSCTESKLTWRFYLFEDSPNPPGRTGRTPTDSSFFAQFDISDLMRRGASYKEGFIGKLPDGTSDTGPKTHAKLRLFNDFKRHLKTALGHVANNNGLWS